MNTELHPEPKPSQAPTAQQEPAQRVRVERHCPRCGARNELVVALHTLASHFENSLYAFRDDAEALRKAKGDIAHAMKIAAKHNQNGPGCAPAAPAPVQADERQAFEAWAVTQPRHEGASMRFLALNNAYIDFDLHGAWLAWQAARAAPPPQTTDAQPVALASQDDARDAARYRIVRGDLCDSNNYELRYRCFDEDGSLLHSHDLDDACDAAIDSAIASTAKDRT